MEPEKNYKAVIRRASTTYSDAKKRKIMVKAGILNKGDGKVAERYRAVYALSNE